MPPRPKRLPRHFHDARREHGGAFATLSLSDPARYAEQLALVQAMARRADHWRTNEIRLPRGVQLVPMLDDDGRTVHAIDWGRTPPPAPPAYFHDRAMAVELAWTVFMLRRPWAIDDERLRALVEHPPAPHPRILSELLSLRFADWARRAFGVMAQACIDEPPPDHPLEALEDVFRDFAHLLERFKGRATLSIHELSGLLDVAEPDSGFGHETHRWRWMLHDYAHALDPQLHERLEALAARYDSTAPKGVREAWDTLLDCRQLDACLGLLLARAAMLDRQPRPTTVQGYVDPMATRAAGSFAWWCRWTLDAWDDEHPLGDRLPENEIPIFVNFALLKLEELDPGLRDVLLRVFPMVLG